MAIRIVARDHIKPECKEEALALLKELVEATRKEPGNVMYQYCQDLKEPDFFVMLEAWEDDASMKSHMSSEHFTRIFPQLAKMMAEPSRLEVYKEVL